MSKSVTVPTSYAFLSKTLEFKTDDKIQELTQLQNDLISKQVFEKPDYWLWQHKRFKKYHKDIYKKEKSV